MAKLVRAAGVTSPVMGTPSLALGAYEVMPVDSPKPTLSSRIRACT